MPESSLLFALSTGAAVLIVVAAFAGIVLLWGISVYNGLIRLRNGYKNAFSQIDVQLKRRYDLIPNLVETAKGYMKHERETLEAVIQARAAAVNAQQAASQNPGDPDTMKAFNGAEGQLNSVLSRLMMVCESYPDLKANQNMLQLQEELTSTENRVAYARQAYNDAVTAYNNAREIFPSSVIAGMGGFTQAALMEIENQEERKAPKISF